MLQNELVAFNIILIWACIRCFDINRGAPFNQQDSITVLVPWCGFAEETQCQIRFDVTHLPAPSTVAVFRPLPLYRPFLRPRPICAIHNANESLNSHFQQIGLGAHDLPCPRLPPQQIGASRSNVRQVFLKVVIPFEASSKIRVFIDLFIHLFIERFFRCVCVFVCAWFWVRFLIDF